MRFFRLAIVVTEPIVIKHKRQKRVKVNKEFGLNKREKNKYIINNRRNNYKKIERLKNLPDFISTRSTFPYFLKSLSKSD